MHPNKAFRQTPEARARAFAAERGFGIFTAAGPDGPLASHVPFVLNDNRAEAHLVRSTPLARLLRQGPVTALMIVSGPDGYVSPDWYGEEDRVPTWNYIAVHLRGTLGLAPETSLRGHLERLSQSFETRLAPKPVWTLDKVDGQSLEKMLRAILPVTFDIDRVESTFKLNQNRPAPAREGAAAAMVKGGTPGMETAWLAGLMRAVDGG